MGPRNQDFHNPSGYADVHALKWLKCENHWWAHHSLLPTHMCSFTVYQFLNYPSTPFSSLLPLPAPVQVTAHLGDGRCRPVGVTNASPLSPNPVSTRKPDLAFENAKLVVLGSCLKPCYVFKFPPVQGHKRVLLQPLWVTYILPTTDPTKHQSEERREPCFQSVLKRAAPVTAWERT